MGATLFAVGFQQPNTADFLGSCTAGLRRHARLLYTGGRELLTPPFPVRRCAGDGARSRDLAQGLRPATSYPAKGFRKPYRGFQGLARVHDFCQGCESRAKILVHHVLGGIYQKYEDISRVCYPCYYYSRICGPLLGEDEKEDHAEAA